MNVRRIAAIVTVCLGVGSAAHTPAQTPNLSRTQRDLHAALLMAVDDAAKADESDDASVRTHVLRASDGSHYVAISAEPPASVTMPTRPMPVYIRLASAPPVAAQRPERSPTREWLVGQQTTPPPISRSGIALGDMPFLEFVVDDTGIGGVAVLYTITGKALHDVSDRDRVWLLNVMRLRSHPPRRQRRQRSVGRAQQPRHHLSRQAARDPEPPFSPRTSTNPTRPPRPAPRPPHLPRAPRPPGARPARRSSCRSRQRVRVRARARQRGVERDDSGARGRRGLRPCGRTADRDQHRDVSHGDDLSKRI